MGVDTVAIAQHHLSFDEMIHVPEKLYPVVEVIKSDENTLKEYFRTPVPWPVGKQGDIRLAWEWREDMGPDDIPDLEIDEPELVGSYFFDISFGSSIYAIDLPPRWRQFVEDADIRSACTNICEAIVRALDGNKIVYVPDSAYCPSFIATDYNEFADLDAVEKWLLKECGGPAKSISEIFSKISDNRMIQYHPDWDRSPDTKSYDCDGYYISVLATALTR